MPSRRFVVVFGPLVVLAACSSKKNVLPDAHIIVDDSQPIDNPPPPPGCDYGELNDTGNDYGPPATGMAETTNVAFTTQSVFCGKLNNGHFASADKRVDIDSFLFDVSATSDVVATLVAPGAEALDSVAFYIYDPGLGTTVFSGSFIGDHAIGIGNLPAGTYELDLEAYGPADPAAPIDYKVKIVTDTPAARCPKVTAAANFTEAGDGGANTGNDIINIDYNAPMGTAGTTLTSAADAAEVTNLTLAAGTSYRITGTEGTGATVGSYIERDTYKIRTGATTNQLSVRLNWPTTPTTPADLDFYLFPEGTTADIASGAVEANAEDEFAVFAVKPNTNYWLWVGLYTGSTPNSTYSASLCPETFTP